MTHSNRRVFVKGALSSVPALVLPACGGRSDLDEGWPGAGAAASGGASGVSAGGTSNVGGAASADGSGGSVGMHCWLYPQQTQGPYYHPDHLLRSHLSEGKPGTLLTVELTLVDTLCQALAHVPIDLWHCDAAGTYSGFAQEGTEGLTFLRGIQRTDRAGVSSFTTIYPGWYPGRAVHIHVQVHTGGRVVHTGQLFFPDALTDTVYRRAPYNRRPARTTRNADDSIFVNGGRRSMLRLARSGSGYVGRMTMGVQRG